MWRSIQVLPSQVTKESFYAFGDIGLRRSHAKVNKGPSENLEADSILGLEISIYPEYLLSSSGL